MTLEITVKYHVFITVKQTEELDCVQGCYPPVVLSLNQFPSF